MTMEAPNIPGGLRLGASTGLMQVSCMQTLHQAVDTFSAEHQEPHGQPGGGCRFTRFASVHMGCVSLPANSFVRMSVTSITPLTCAARVLSLRESLAP